jgi:hypothetical protein
MLLFPIHTENDWEGKGREATKRGVRALAADSQPFSLL